MDWQQSNNSYFAAITVEQNVMFLILMLIVLVAAFNVISTLIMMVKDKSQDIAVMRTIGAGRGAILRVFLMVGTAIGVAGTAVGERDRRACSALHRGHPALRGARSPGRPCSTRPSTT